MGSLSEMYGQQDDVRRKQEARKEYLASLGTHCVYNFIFKFMIGFSDEQIRMKKERQAAAKKKQMEHDKLVQSHLVCSPNFSSHPSQTCFHVHSVSVLWRELPRRRAGTAGSTTESQRWERCGEQRPSHGGGAYPRARAGHQSFFTKVRQRCKF